MKYILIPLWFFTVALLYQIFLIVVVPILMLLNLFWELKLAKLSLTNYEEERTWIRIEEGRVNHGTEEIIYKTAFHWAYVKTRKYLKTKDSGSDDRSLATGREVDHM